MVSSSHHTWRIVGAQYILTALYHILHPITAKSQNLLTLYPPLLLPGPGYHHHLPIAPFQVGSCSCTCALKPCSPHSSWGILLKHMPEYFISLRRTHFHGDCGLLSSLICTLTFCQPLGSLPSSPSVFLLLSLAETPTRPHLSHSQSSHTHVLLDLGCTSPSGSTHSLNMLPVPDLSSVSCVSSNLTVHPRPTPYYSCTGSFEP